MLEIKHEVATRDILRSNYYINFEVCSYSSEAQNILYTYFLDYRNGQALFGRKYSDDIEELLSINFLFYDYRKTSIIPILFNEMVETYINENRDFHLNYVLPLIKTIQIGVSEDLKPIQDRQEVFSKEEFNQKLLNILIPEENGKFFIQPINVNRHFSNIIISNENGQKKYYLYDSLIGNHRKDRNTLNEYIFSDELIKYIKVLPIDNLQKNTNTCGFFCMLFTDISARKTDINILLQSIDNREMQSQISLKVFELVGREKICDKRKEKNGKITINAIEKTIRDGQGFGIDVQFQENIEKSSQEGFLNPFLQGI